MSPNNQTKLMRQSLSSKNTMLINDKQYIFQLLIQNGRQSWCKCLTGSKRYTTKGEWIDQLHSLAYIKSQIDAFLSSPIYEIFMTLVTFVVLFSDDFRILQLSKSQDDTYQYFMLTCFIAFMIEIIFMSIVKSGYIFSFFFWMDLASTFSMVLELPIIMSDLLGIESFSSSKSTRLAKAGRASRVSTRATKIIRVIRLIRLVRIAKLYKYAYKGLESRMSQSHKNSENRSAQDIQQISQNILQIDDLDHKDQEGQYNYKMIPRPQLKEEYLQEQLEHIKKKKRSDVASRFNPMTNQNRSTVKIDINYINSQIVRNLPANEATERKPIFYEEQKSDPSNEEGIEDQEEQIQSPQDQQQMLPGEELILNGAGLDQMETQVGKQLSDLTTKRAIMVMFSIMVSIPLLDYDTYFSDPDGYQIGLNILEKSYLNNDTVIQEQGLLITVSQFLQSPLDTDINQILFLQIDQYYARNISLYLDRRDEEMNQFQSESLVSLLLVDNKEQTNLNAILGIIRTSFVIFVLVTGAIFFSKDSNDLVVTPIENMLVKVKRIAQNPLEAARIEEDLAMAEEQLKRQKLDEKLKRNKQQDNGLETVILEKLIVKTGALLAVGFGEAGASIIAQNLNFDGDVNPMLPGKKIFAIFGFCDVRYFSDMTEVLEEQVFVFVNEVAEIVHSTVDAFEGATNKNIGDAFLLVWKMPEDALKMGKEYPEIVNIRLVNNYADMALLAFIKIFISVRKSAKLKKYSENEEVQQKLPHFSVKMGFGLHVGWAIEGAIGSFFKIDASYLSPNVNMASRLEAATKQYGVYHLVSGPFYRLLSKLAQAKLRHLDRVTVKGSIQPIDIFTFDFDVESLEGMNEYKKVSFNRKIQRYQDRQKKENRMKNIRKEKYNINALFNNDADIKLVQEKYTEIFFSEFHDGVNSYLYGRWQFAKKCFEKTKVKNIQGDINIKDMLNTIDGPSLTLLNYMQNFNFEAPDDWKGYRELTEK